MGGPKPEAPPERKPSDDDSRSNGGSMDNEVGVWKQTNFAQLSEYFKKMGWTKRITIVSVLLGLAFSGYASGIIDFNESV